MSRYYRVHQCGIWYLHRIQYDIFYDHNTSLSKYGSYADSGRPNNSHMLSRLSNIGSCIGAAPSKFDSYIHVPQQNLVPKFIRPSKISFPSCSQFPPMHAIATGSMRTKSTPSPTSSNPHSRTAEQCVKLWRGGTRACPLQ